jgi:hypothetical protein
MDKALTLAALLGLTAGPASALAYACLYTTECLETEACQDTAFDLWVEVADDFSSATLSSVTGDVQTTAYNAQFLSYFAGYANRTMHVVSVSGQGESRYSIQNGSGDTILSITYHGTCEPV